MEQIRDRGGIKGLKVVLILPPIFLCLAFLLKILYSLPLRDSFLWYAGVFFCFYIPGNLLVRCTGFNKDEYFVNFFHSTALGAALIPLAYIIFRRLSHPEMLYPFGIAIFLVWLILTLKDLKNSKIDVYTTYQDILSVTVLIFVVFILLHLSHFTDVILLENGFKIRNEYHTETIFHLGIVNVLKDTFHPFFPYASGHNFSHYHLNMHLEIEMFYRLFSIDTIKLTFFYFPLLYFCLLVCIPYIFVRKYCGLRSLGVLTGILMFGSDLSFIPGLLSTALLGASLQDYPWTLYTQTTIWSLFTLNGYLPALFVMFMCVFYLKKYYEDGGLLHLLIFAVLGYSSYGFKSSMGPHIMGVAFLTGIASIVLMKDRKKGMILCIVSALTILLIVFDIILFRKGTGQDIFVLDLFNNLRSSLKELGISNMSLVLYPIAYPIYIIATFGARLVGFYSLKDGFKKKNSDPVILFLAIFVISGFLISEIIYIGPPSRNINKAVFLSIESLMAAWLLLFYFLIRLKDYRKNILGYLFVVILLSAPTTVQFLNIRFDNTYHYVDQDAMEIVNYLKTTPTRSVILHPLNEKEPSLSSNFAGRQSVINIFMSFINDWVGLEEGNNRVMATASFFREGGANRASILSKYKVDYVYAPSKFTIDLDNEPMLIRVLKNRKYALYKVDRANNHLK